MNYLVKKSKITLMQKYSLTVLIKEKVSETDRNGIFDVLKKSFSNLIKEDLWGIRSLAYAIKHENKAFYAYFEFEAEPQAVITLDKNIRLNEDIIRHLIIRIETKRQKVRSIKKDDKKTDFKEVEIEVKDKEEISKELPEAGKEGKGKAKQK